MPIRPSNNVVGKYIEFDTDLAEQVAAFAAARRQKFREVVMEALRRHLAFPPPTTPAAFPPLPPLLSSPTGPPVARPEPPAATEPAPKKPARKPRKGKGGAE